MNAARYWQLRDDGGLRDFSENLRASLFNDDRSNESTLSQIISLDITFNGLKTMYFVVKNCTYRMGDPGEMQMGGGKWKGNSSRFCRRCLNIFLLYFLPDKIL
jgi:hypothetical protein